MSIVLGVLAESVANADSHSSLTQQFLGRGSERLHPREVEHYLQALASLSEVVKPHPGIPIIAKDINDDPIIYTAVTGKADVLCTLDAHFYEESVKSFCAQRSILIMDDVELLRVMRTREGQTK